MMHNANQPFRDDYSTSSNSLTIEMNDLTTASSGTCCGSQMASKPHSVVELGVGGMTCSMCSDAVKKGLSSMDGVISVTVSLATNSAKVVYLESEDCNPNIIQEFVEHIGYDVTDLVILSRGIDQNQQQQQQQQQQENQYEVRRKILDVSIGGMTCSMCSSAVQKALQAIPGVTQVSVSLATNVARIEYEESDDCHPDLLTETIEDIGYDVHDVTSVPTSYRDEEGVGQGHPYNKTPDYEMIEEGDDRLARILKQQAAQLQARRRDFVWCFVGTLPILSITMWIPDIMGPDCDLMKFLKRSVEILGHPFVRESLLLWLFTTPVQFGCGYSLYKTSYYGILGRVYGMDVLVTLGMTASYLYAVMATWEMQPGYRFFETSVVLLCFVLLGKYMNAMAVCRTSDALTSLMKLQAKTALRVTPVDNEGSINATSWDPLIDAYREELVPIQQIRPGDMVKILKGASIPADGVLAHGEMCVDESMITGESIPVLKSLGSTVLGGTICTETGQNGGKSTTAGAFVSVTGVGASTTLAQIVQLVQEAQSRQVPIQNLADGISSIFVPAVVTISFATFLIWYGCCRLGLVPSAWHEGESAATFSLLFGIACLVISCPCALGLATPTAVMVGTGVGARHGVLMKGGAALEVAGKVNALIFDKTGTLTKGKPEVTDWKVIVPDSYLQGIADEIGKSVEHALLWLVGSLERNSEHPIASAVVRYAESALTVAGCEDFAQPTDFVAMTGCGASGIIKGNIEVTAGNRSFARHKQMKITTQVESLLQELEEEGKTAIVVGVNGQVCAVLGVADELKEDAMASIIYLEGHGVKVWMVTGDSRRTADTIARQLNLCPERVISEALPSTKVEQVRRLQAQGFTVAMAGDGVNDSPALAEADVGIGMGTGAEIATEASDMVLVSGKVSDVCTALDLSRTIFRRIKWNLLFSMVYNLLSIPLAAGLFFPMFHTRLPPTIAALAMALSSVSVVCSSLALRWYRPPEVYDGQRQRRLPRILDRMIHPSSYVAVSGNEEMEDPQLPVFDDVVYLDVSYLQMTPTMARWIRTPNSIMERMVEEC